MKSEIYVHSSMTKELLSDFLPDQNQDPDQVIWESHLGFS